MRQGKLECRKPKIRKEQIFKTNSKSIHIYIMYVCIVCVFLLDLNICRESGTGYMDNVLLFHAGPNIL